jgi:hypothetical protein
MPFDRMLKELNCPLLGDQETAIFKYGEKEI